MKTENFLKDYARHLSDEDLRFASGRLVQSLCGDVAEVLEFFSKNSELDKWFKTATNSGEFFAMLDQLEVAFNNEIDKRNQLADKKEEKRHKKSRVVITNDSKSE